MIELTRQYGRYGYRRIAALLREAGRSVSDGRIDRLWRREGLKVPAKQPKKGRLWLNDGSCVRLRPEYCNHVWSCDFVHCRTDDGKTFRTLNILDEHSQGVPPLGRLQCNHLPGDGTIRVKRKLNSVDVIDALTRTVHTAWRAPRIHTFRQCGPEFICPGRPRLDNAAVGVTDGLR